MNIRIAIIAVSMAIMTAFGGIITAGVNADYDEDVTQEITEAVQEIEDEPEIAPEEITPEAVPEDVNENNDECYNEQVKAPSTPAEIIADQTGLVVDYIKVVDTYGSWGAYYIHSDGDLYIVTIDDGSVDVCVILN